MLWLLPRLTRDNTLVPYPALFRLCHHADTRRPHPTRGHAGVGGVDDHRDAMRAEMFPDAVRHLGGEPLLHLQAAGKAVQHARQLGYADHPVARKIGDMRLADDRRQVMLAVRLAGNVLQKHDLVIAAHLAEGAVKLGRWFILIAASICHPPRAATRMQYVAPTLGR